MRKKTAAKVEVELSAKAAKALDEARGPQSREEYLSGWIEAHWRGASSK